MSLRIIWENISFQSLILAASESAPQKVNKRLDAYKTHVYFSTMVISFVHTPFITYIMSLQAIEHKETLCY